MQNDCKYLFVYGTLLKNDNEFGALLKNNSRHVAGGSMPGYLYDLGEYPGAIYDPAASQKVYGEIVLLNNTPRILEALDEYEGFGNDNEQPDLFIRKVISVATGTDVIDCHVYLYNRPVNGYPQILSGKYSA